MKVLVTGGRGQLAKAIGMTWKQHDVVLLDEIELDLGAPGAAQAALDCHRPDVVVNAGAHTLVDRCEVEKDLAYRINAVGVRWLARACRKRGALLLQLSTDYVFDGQAREPYREWDPTGPATVYGASKLAGEVETTAHAPEHLIVRTSWLFDAWGANFLLTMLGLAREQKPIRVVMDQIGAPTSCRALARQLLVLVEKGERGLVHASCHGETTWYGFAHRIFELAPQGSGGQVDLRPCATVEFPRPAPRPAYSVLSAATREAMGVDVMPSWEEALAEVLGDPR
ncbi:MAG: dTDP-4-dehydrorhamnose reductase [Pseudomonadota bacterium]